MTEQSTARAREGLLHLHVDGSGSICQSNSMSPLAVKHSSQAQKPPIIYTVMAIINDLFLRRQTLGEFGSFNLLNTKSDKIYKL